MIKTNLKELAFICMPYINFLSLLLAIYLLWGVIDYRTGWNDAINSSKEAVETCFLWRKE